MAAKVSTAPGSTGPAHGTTTGQLADQFMADRTAEPGLSLDAVRRDVAADQAHAPSAPDTAAPTPAMDYREHVGTYQRFQRFTEIGILGVVNIVMVLAVWTFVKSFPWMLVGLLLALGAVALGIARPRLGWRPGLIVLGILGLRVLFH